MVRSNKGLVCVINEHCNDQKAKVDLKRVSMSKLEYRGAHFSRRQLVNIATDLGYAQKYIDQLKSSKSVEESQRIIRAARRDRYRD